MNRKLTGLTGLGIILLLAACANTTPDRYPGVEAFHPDGSGGGVTPDRDALENMTGSVMSYAPGDEIDLTLKLTSNVTHFKGPVTTTLIVDRPIRIANGPGGMLVSIEGEPWQRPLAAFEGAFGASLSILREEQANHGRIDVTANER
jgi:hypothetical protein